jgi:hypothetical protein
MVTRLDEVDACMDLMDYSFDLDYAVGNQLDILGEIVGIKRTLPFQPNYGISPTLTDEDYRTLLKATIGKNHWDGIQGSLSSLWAVLFPDATLATHDNNIYDRMSMDIFIEFPNRSSVFVDLAVRDYIIPRPEGVKPRYYVGPPFPLFGFDYFDPYVAGFDLGNWYASTHRYPEFGFDLDTNLLAGFDRGNWGPAEPVEDTFIVDEFGAFLTGPDGNLLIV